MNKNKRLVFGIDANQVTVKKLLSKDFLELSMKAISSANPNRNGSWFTPESLQKALPTFKNKPILGYFENGDFVSHNGNWDKDDETNMTYWDTLGKQGERILGLIRSEDDVSIQEEGGLQWIVLTCALWVQYSYKQVKRLLKDAIRAQQSGGSTKSISVEIDITDYETMENGIMKIKDFNLIGITILGSRNGRAVEPGIVGANLSVLEMMDRDVYVLQQQALRVAYAKLEEPDVNKNKEEFSMDNIPETEVVTTPTVEEANIPETNSTETTSGGPSNFEEGQVENQEPGIIAQLQEEGPATPAEVEPTITETEVTPAEFEGATPAVAEVEGAPVEEENPVTPDPIVATEQMSLTEEIEHEPETNPIHDLSSLIDNLSWDVERYTETIKHYEDHLDIVGREFVLLVLYRLKEQAVSNIKELAEVLSIVAAGVTEEDMLYAKELSEHCDHKTLYGEYVASQKECEELKINYATLNENHEGLKTKVAQFENEAMLAEAKRLTSQCSIKKEVVTSIYDKCSKGQYASLEALKAEVALAAFDANFKVEETSFSAQIVETPVVSSVGSAEKPSKRSSWEVLTDYSKK